MRGRHGFARLLKLTALLAPALLFPSAHAQTPAFTISNTGYGLWDTRNFMEGWAFAVNTPIQVEALGVFDDNLDGLSDPHEIGIFDSTGALLTSATVSPGTANPSVNQFRYASPPGPLVLSPGQTYTIGLFYPGHYSDSLIAQATGFITASEVDYLEDRQLQTSSFTMPTVSLPAYYSPGIFGPNFVFTPLAVPEPCPVLLLTGGCAGWIGILLRRRSAGYQPH